MLRSFGCSFSGRAGSGKDTCARLLMKMVSRDPDIRANLATGRAPYWPYALHVHSNQQSNASLARTIQGIWAGPDYLTALKEARAREATELSPPPAERAPRDGAFLVRKYAFADRLKDAASYIFAIDRAVFDDTAKKELPIARLTRPDGPLTPRRIIQLLGTEVGRSIYENTWIEAMHRDIDEDRPDFACVTDARFVNELRSIEERGWPRFRVIRPRLETLTASKGHSSETQQDEYTNYTDLLINPAGPSPTKEDMAALRREVTRIAFPKVKEALLTNYTADGLAARVSMDRIAALAAGPEGA
jgi:hypothetical protein